jgi:hypothetical protein
MRINRISRSLGLLVLVGLWLEAKETFKAQVTVALSTVPGTFTVSEQGYDWTTDEGHYHSNGVTPWKDVRRWSCTGEVSGFALDIHSQTGVSEFRLRHDDLVHVVNDYFKKYASEKLDKQEGCNPES